TGYRLQREERVPGRGKERDQREAQARQRVEREAVGELAGADTELPLRMTVEQRSDLDQGRFGIDVRRERGVVGEILLQKAVAAIHRAVRGEGEHQVVAARHATRARG